MRILFVMIIGMMGVGCEPSTIVTTNITSPTSPTPIYTPTPTTTPPTQTTPCSTTPNCNPTTTNPPIGSNPTKPPEIITFSADSFRVNHPNIPVILRWDVSDFNAIVRIDPSVGSVSPVGFAVVFPSATTVYTLTARNNIGIAQRTLIITMASSD
jgi:hypothetical protein